MIYSIIISCLLIRFNETIGIYCSDVYIYLYNSLVFARMASNTNFLYLSPFICFLTSILFRLGHISELSIYIVTGIFSIFASLGIYLLLRGYFSSLLSLTGGVLFTSFSLNLLWCANGTLDIPAVGLSIWAILFLILAVDENPRYYLLAFPLLVLGIFTRYTCLFLVPLFLLFYLSKHDFFYFLDSLFFDRKESFLNVKSFLKSGEFKYGVVGLVLALILVLIFNFLILHFGGHFSFLKQGLNIASGSKGAVVDNAYTTDALFYLHDFLNFLFAQKVFIDEKFIPHLIGASFVSYLVLFLLIFGIGIIVYKLFNGFNGNSLDLSEGIPYKTKHFKNLLILLLIISSIIAILGYKINSLITITFLLVDFVVIFSLLKNNGVDRKAYSAPIFMAGWFLVYFIFFTFLNIKVDRYIITVFPAFIYFVVLALDEILELLNEKSFRICNFNLSYLIPIILIIICLFSAFTFTSTFEQDLDFNNYKVVADYLIDYDGDYASKDIASFKRRPFNWWLKDYTIPLTVNQTDYLESSNITYYICDEDLSLENYTKIYNYKDIFLYERIK